MDIFLMKFTTNICYIVQIPNIKKSLGKCFRWGGSEDSPDSISIRLNFQENRYFFKGIFIQIYLEDIGIWWRGWAQSGFFFFFRTVLHSWVFRIKSIIVPFSPVCEFVHPQISTKAAAMKANETLIRKLVMLNIPAKDLKALNVIILFELF